MKSKQLLPGVKSGTSDFSLTASTKRAFKKIKQSIKCFVETLRQRTSWNGGCRTEPPGSWDKGGGCRYRRLPGSGGRLRDTEDTRESHRGPCLHDGHCSRAAEKHALARGCRHRTGVGEVTAECCHFVKASCESQGGTASLGGGEGQCQVPGEGLYGWRGSKGEKVMDTHVRLQQGACHSPCSALSTVGIQRKDDLVTREPSRGPDARLDTSGVGGRVKIQE